MSEAPLVEVDPEIDVSGALIVCCFPSLGFVSSIVAHYLVEKLELKLVGGVRHHSLPPVCLVQEGLPLPPLRFYSGEPICNMKECNKVILIASEIQISSKLCLPLTEALLNWCETNNTGPMIMVDAYAIGIEHKHTIFDDDDSTETLLGIGSTAAAHKILTDLEVPLLQQGVVGGMTGVMMGECRRRNSIGMAILAESSGKIGNGAIPDARAAARIIECLDGLLPAVHLDPEPLLEEAQRLEQQIRDMMAATLNPVAEDASSAPTTMYG
jgi:uncharacterized protein